MRILGLGAFGTIQVLHVVQAATRHEPADDDASGGVLSRTTLFIPAGYKAQLVLYSAAALLIWASVLGVLLCARRPLLGRGRGRSVPSTPRRPLHVAV